MPDKIIILRPEADCADYIAQVEAMGYCAIAEEILSVSFTDYELPEVGPEVPLVFTSANGVRAFARLSGERDRFVFTVGDNTAEAARRAGFTKLESAGGTAEDLTRLLLKRRETGLTSIFYVRGADISVNFPEILAESGIKTSEFIGYKANLSHSLSENALNSLEIGDVKAVLMFSARGAAHFAGFVRQNGRQAALKTVQALCIGEGMLESFRDLPFKEVVVAPSPDRYGMMCLLQSLPNQNKE